MRISLLELRRGLDRLELSSAPEALDLPADWFNQPVDASLSIRAIYGGWQVELEIRTRVRRTCDRCLAEQELALAEQEKCLVLEAGGLDDADDDCIIRVTHDQEWVDLAQVVRDALVLSQPDYFFCRVDCQGLCPQCGQNLDEGSCACRPPAPDAPFQSLAELRRKS